MNVKKSSSSYNIIDSGTLMNYMINDSIQLDLEFEENFSFSIELSFEDNPNVERQLKQQVVPEHNLIKITCVNFDNSLGTGTTKPIELASFGGKKVYIHFWVYSLGRESVRKVDYCLYQER